jgi:hypothetical protein
MSDDFWIASICATAVVVGVFFFDVYFVDDSNSHVYAIWERVTNCIMFISSWPVLVASLIRGEDPPITLWILLWVLSGMFWGLIIELCLRRREIRRA